MTETPGRSTLLWSVCHHMLESGSPTHWPQILPFQPVQEICSDEELKSDLHLSSLIFTINLLLKTVRLSSVYTGLQPYDPTLKSPFLSDVNLFLLHLTVEMIATCQLMKPVFFNGRKVAVNHLRSLRTPTQSLLCLSLLVWHEASPTSLPVFLSFFLSHGSCTQSHGPVT